MPAERPQGTVTILFTDVVDSTALATGRGDAASHAILQQQRALVRKNVEEHAGTEVKTMGDGFMVAFTSARQGVACAIAIQQAFDVHRRSDPATALQIRIGLNTAETISEGADFFGAGVNAAERVMQKAGGGEIYVSESVRAVLGAGTDFRLDDRGRFRLKGFPERLRLYEVAWRTDVQPDQALPIGRLPFVDREAERAVLDQAVERARQGHGSLVLISGEAGVGKTRLVEESATHARQRGMFTFTGRCYENAGDPPYGPFTEILEAMAAALPPDALKDALGEAAPAIAQLVPSLRRPAHVIHVEALQPSVAPHPLFAAAQTFLAAVASVRPLLLLLDDVQWADAASIQLLRFLARRIDSLPIIVVGTYREGAFDMGAPLAQAIDEFDRTRLAIHVNVLPFEVEAVEALLQASSGRPPPPSVARAFHDETSGNPFFVEELYRELAETGRLFDEAHAWRSDLRIAPGTLPRSVRIVVGRRLDRLAPSTRLALDAAAILGASFQIDVLEATSAIAGGEFLDSLDEAEHARIIVPVEGAHAAGRFRFAHPLIRSAIIAGLSSSRRQRLHVQAAAAIENVADRSAALDSELAHHYRAAGQLADPVRAVAAMLRAGEAGLAAYANLEAKAHFDAALALAERASNIPSGCLADVVHECGKVEFRLGEWARSRELLDRALALCRQSGDTEREARVLYSSASLATFDARPRDALACLAQARDLMPEDEPLLGLVLQLESQNLVDLRQYADAERAADAALVIGARIGGAYLVNHTLMASGYFALATLDMPRAVRDFARIVDAEEALPHERMAAESRRSIALACMGALDEAGERSSRARAYFGSMHDARDSQSGDGVERDPYESALACVAAAVSDIARGRFEETLTLLGDAIRESGKPPNTRVARTLNPMIVQALHYQGRCDDAAAAVEAFAPAGGGREPAFRRLYNVLAAAQSTADRSDIVMPPASVNRPDLPSLPLHVMAAETALALGDADAAGGLLPSIEYLHDRGVIFTSGWVVLVPRLYGALRRLAGDFDGAATLLDAARAVAHAQNAATELALTHLELAELNAAQGRTAAARVDLAEATKLFARLGIHCRDAQAATLDARLRAGRSGAAAPLTESEAELLRLVAAGLTNRDIAAKCSLNERAVQRQLTSLYGKLGVSGRVAAIAYAYKHGIAGDSD